MYIAIYFHDFVHTKKEVDVDDVTSFILNKNLKFKMGVRIAIKSEETSS